MIDDGWTIEAAADNFQVDAKTVTKWRNRFLDVGDEGLLDRSSNLKTHSPSPSTEPDPRNEPNLDD